MTVTTKREEKITASKGVLNELSLVYYYASKYMESINRDAHVKEYTDKANAIYEQLEAIGFYND